MLSSSVALAATIIGAPLGVLLGRTDLPLRGAFTMLLTLPLLVPPYVMAVAWFAVLGSTGWIGRFCRLAIRLSLFSVLRSVWLHRDVIHRLHADRHAVDDRICRHGESPLGAGRAIDKRAGRTCSGASLCR